MSEWISMSEERARTVLEQWRAARSAEVDACWQRYLAFGPGLPLIDLHRAIAAAGWDRLGRPRLLAARAEDVVVHVSWTAPFLSVEAQSDRRRILMPPRNDGEAILDAWAGVPATAAADLTGLVLWKPSWESASAPECARPAPIVLQHLGGPLWVAVHQHRPTPEEAAAMA